MKKIEKKGNKVIIDGIEYVPKEKQKKSTIIEDWKQILNKHINETVYYINPYGFIVDTNLEPKSDLQSFYNKDRAKAMVLLKMLLEIRDEYNRDWKPDWINKDMKWYIYPKNLQLQVSSYYFSTCSEFMFATEELAEQFLDKYRKELEFVFTNLYMWK